MQKDMASIKVLYVDDEPELRDIVKTFLERSGEIQLDTVPSVTEAEKALTSGQYDAIISDYQMPVMDGLEFLKRLRSEDNDIPFILFTGRGREEVVIEALNSGADFYMQKGGSPQTQFAELEHYVVRGVKNNRTERARRESEEYFRSLVNNSFEGICVHIDGNVVETNQALCDICGYSRQEMMGKSFADIFTPETMKVMREKFKLPFTGHYDAQVLRKDGQIVSALTTGKDIIWKGRAARLGTVFDITERTKMEEKLRQSEKNYRTLIETSPDIIWEADRNGNFTYISPQITDMLGYSQEELIGRPFSALTTSGSTTLAKERFSSHMRAPERHVSLEVTVNHKNGDLRTIEICSGPFLDDAGNLIGFRGNARDVTERRRAEKAEKEASALLSAILESSPDVIVFALDSEYRYLAFNKRHQETMKAIWGREISVGMSMLDIVGKDEDRQKARVNFDQALAGRSFTVTEEYGDESLNRWTWQDYYSPIINDDRQIVGVTCYCLNTTERERAKDELQDANNKLRIITSITRHDMLNKLTVLHGYLQLEQARAVEGKTADHLAKMVQITRNLESQINFTKEYQDIGSFKPTWQTLKDVCLHAQEQMDHGDVDVQLELDGLEMYADPMLKKVFYNLMDNSMKHGQHVQTIRIGYEASNGHVMIVYRDDGVGVSVKDKEKLFIEGSSNHGLGLFLAKEILKITDIIIKENGEPGNGVRFEMDVPPGKYRFQNP